MRADELYKFSDETLKKVSDELHHRIHDFRLEYNMEMPRRKWTDIDRKRSELMVELIDKQMSERRIIRNLKRLVGALELDMDYKLMTSLPVLELAICLEFRHRFDPLCCQRFELIGSVGSKNHPPMLNKENYVPWSSRLLRYAKSRPNRKLIYNSILNDDELTKKELKQVEDDDQAIQTILLGLPEDIYAVVDSCETTQEICTTKGVDVLRELTTCKNTSSFDLMENSTILNQLSTFSQQDQPSPSTYMQQPLPNNNNYNPQPSFNQNYMQQPMPNPEDITDPTTAINMALVLMAKAFKLNYSTPTNNNQRILSNPRNRQIAQPVQNPAARAEGNAIGNNDNQIRCYNCIGLGHLARNCTVKPRRMDAAYLQTQLLIAQKEEQALTSGTQTEKAPVYDLDGSTEVHDYDNCYNNEIFDMFTQAEHYTELLKPILKPHQVQQNDSNISFEVSVEKVNTVNRKLRETNADLTTQLASSGKQITTLNEEIANLNNQLSKEKSTVSSLQEDKKKLKSGFKIREDKFLDKQIQLENKIKELDNISDEIFPIINQVDARLQNFEIQFFKEAAKFVRDFKSLAKEADESLAKHKALELEIESLLRAVVSQDIMSIVQSNSVVDTSNLQNELDPYNDMQQKIKRLQAQLEDPKGKYKDTLGVSDTLDPLSQKLENENVELEFQVLNYAKENALLKTIYKNLFDSIKVTQAQTKTIIDSLQDKLHDTIYENAKLRDQLFDKVSKQKDTTKGTSVNTQFCKQSILGKPPSSFELKLYVVTPFPKSNGLPKIDETHALSKPVTSNSAPTPQELKVVKNVNVIAPGMCRINPFKNYSEENVNSNSNGLSSIGVDNTDKTRRPQPMSNTKNDMVPSASKVGWYKVTKVT
ncbi:retrovirus-related pol polyprotein from transposon TNT 1-94 [Tanacetum coccineum]